MNTRVKVLASSTRRRELTHWCLMQYAHASSLVLCLAQCTRVFAHAGNTVKLTVISLVPFVNRKRRTILGAP
ncbi:hypothetical protein NDU88_002778 [Pleurodeles waltl]|uniref:Secreted protein n=1 Tax=Pleurodeles waltl TaxID=8319 RepID=A0AAV7LGQ9_PLEWA|nr:hypothetical protein NDU88_002778 [Pleurodeles waltl]